MLATQTVRETILTSALLRLPTTMSLEDKEKRVDEQIALFGLEKCQNTFIGDGVKIIGVSGGERKRCSIAMATVVLPPILFLDEPTSGLDAFIAFSVINAMKKLCGMGVTIITTIHQPSSDTFALFDDLLLLVAGSIVYQGAATDTVGYFATQAGFVCPEHSNPADFFFMHVLTMGDEEKKIRTKFVQAERTKALSDAWAGYKKSAGLDVAVKLEGVTATYQHESEASANSHKVNNYGQFKLRK
jgi:ABC-type multidrug transport system ATPase subunit